MKQAVSVAVFTLLVQRKQNEKHLYRILGLFWSAHLWIRILWSWWPCVAIMTSASSRTNTLIFFGSINLNLLHQSSMVPGVPMTICSCSFIPRCTGNKTKTKTSQLNVLSRSVVPNWPVYCKIVFSCASLLKRASDLFLFIFWPSY